MEFGRKNVVGNIPVNIQKCKREGEIEHKLLECKDSLATIRIAVALTGGGEDDNGFGDLGLSKYRSEGGRRRLNLNLLKSRVIKE